MTPSSLESFYITGLSQPISLSERVAKQIFIYGEYLKRQFFLDCTFQKDTNTELGQYLYDRCIFPVFDELDKIFTQQFNINLSSGNITGFSYPFYRNLLYRSHRLYTFITKLYEIEYRNFRKKLVSIPNIREIIKHISKNFNKYTSLEYYITNTGYESLLRYFSDWEKRENPGKTLLEKVMDIIQYKFQIITHAGLSRIYFEIVRRYHLYMYDLIHLKIPLEIIQNNYKISSLPRFIDLPKLSLEKHKFGYLLKSLPNPLDSKLTFSIDFSHHLPIEEIGEFAKNVISYYSFMYNDLNKLDMNEDDYKFASLFLDSTNSHSRKDNFEERIDGLYLWDKKYINLSGKTIRNEILILGNKIKKLTFRNKNEENNFIRRYQHIFKNTVECIEVGQILPIVTSPDKGGQPKPAAG